MAVNEVTDTNFKEEVLDSKIPVLVDFWAPWCAPCRMAEPVLEELSGKYKEKVAFVKINVDENQKVTGDFQVISIPTTVLIKDGKEVGRQIGFAGKDVFEELIKKNMQGGD